MYAAPDRPTDSAARTTQQSKRFSHSGKRQGVEGLAHLDASGLVLFWQRIRTPPPNPQKRRLGRE
jgi:hypothetical protein